MYIYTLWKGSQGMYHVVFRGVPGQVSLDEPEISDDNEGATPEIC